jgi:ABC-type Na+ efflux pump permease subunit
MGIALLFFGYVFGRVTLQVGFGKFIQKHLLSEKNRSETLATLLGVVAWTVLLSVPYFWLAALFAVFAVGIGLILTARSPKSWQKA